MKILIKKIREGLFADNCGYLEVKSNNFYNLISPQTRIKKVATGFKFTEGPVWIRESQNLLFSDIFGNKIYQLNRRNKVTIFRENSHNSNGLTLDGQGRLIACEHGTRRLTRTEKDGSITVLADQFAGKKLNSPNDVVVRSDGLIYFTDPPYGIKSEAQEQPCQGVYCYNPQNHSLTLVADDFDHPNGLAFSLNETLLYIDDSTRHHLRVFDVNNNGTLKNSRIFAQLKMDTEGCPDGMKIDSQGNIYCTGAGGIWVFDGLGNHLGMIVIPEIPANLAWGDDDWKSLYITARTSIYKLRVKVAGKAINS
jgi:gluconolactonase